MPRAPRLASGSSAEVSVLSAVPALFRRHSPAATVAALRVPLLSVAGLLLAACGAGGPPQLPPPAVSVAEVVQQPVTEWDPYEGRITAIESVELRPRVSGYLAGVHFREGSRVEKGALLFTVDDREYRAALDSARANTARAATRAEVARIEAERAEKLRAGRAISDEELESRRGELRQAEADLAAALREAEDLLARARDEARRVAEAAAAEAEAAAKRRERMAMDRIAAAEASAVTEVRHAAAEIATAAVRDVVARRHDAEADGNMVDSAIAGLPQAFRAA